jgi:hypothetical protein
MFTLFLLFLEFLRQISQERLSSQVVFACSALLHSLVVHLHMSGGPILASKLSAGLENRCSISCSYPRPSTVPFNGPATASFVLFTELRGRHAASYRLKTFCLSKVEAAPPPARHKPTVSFVHSSSPCSLHSVSYPLHSADTPGYTAPSQTMYPVHSSSPLPPLPISST